jgi:solute carrier family 35, member F5
MKTPRTAQETCCSDRPSSNSSSSSSSSSYSATAPIHPSKAAALPAAILSGDEGPAPGCCHSFMTKKEYNYALGLLFIVLVALIWAVSSGLVQFLYETESFNSPFLLTYIGVSLFTWPLPVKFITDRLLQPCFQKTMQTCRDIAEVTDLEQCSYGLSRNRDASTTSAESSTGDGIYVASTQESGYIPMESATAAPTAQVGAPKETAARPIEAPTKVSTESRDPGKDPAIYIPESDDTIVSEEEELRVAARVHARWTRNQHIQAAAQIAPVWFLANWTFNASLSLTSIASSTVLLSSCSMFAFAFAVIANDENFHFKKLVGVIIGICGTGLTTLHDYHRDECYIGCKNVLLGDLLALTSAIAFGFYAVQIRVLCPRNEQLYSMQRLLGYIGLINTVILSPVALYELLGNVKMTIIVFELIIVRSVFDYVLSEYLYFRSVILTSATVATLGLALTIPFAFVTDLIMGKTEVVSRSSLLGALAVIVGFLMVNAGSSNEQYDKILLETLVKEDSRRRQQFFCYQVPCGCLVDNWVWCDIDNPTAVENVVAMDHPGSRPTSYPSVPPASSFAYA